MQTLRKVLIISSILFTLGAVTPAAAQAAAKGTDRPLTGYSTSTTTINVATGQATGDGTSRLSHCGTTTFHNDMTFSLTGPDTFRLVGTDTEVCSNGDKVFSALVIDGHVSDGTGTGVFTITGGTGRFADAAGSFVIHAQSTIVSSVGSVLTTSDTNTIDGHISY